MDLICLESYIPPEVSTYLKLAFRAGLRPHTLPSGGSQPDNQNVGVRHLVTSGVNQYGSFRANGGVFLKVRTLAADERHTHRHMQNPAQLLL